MNSAPIPPPADTTSRVAFHDGHIWRRGEAGWETLEPADPFELLRLYRTDAMAADWFAPRAAQIAEELAQAMQDAGLIEHRSAA